MGAGAGERVSDQRCFFNALDLINHSQHDGRHVDAVGNHFNGHVLFGEDAFNGASHFELAILIDHGHGVVEVCGVGHAGFVGAVHVFVGGAGVTDGGKHAVFFAAFDEFNASRQFGCFVPTFQTFVFVKQRSIFVLHGSLDPFGNLSAGLFGIEIGSFEVQTEHGAVGFRHHFVAGFASGFNHGDGGGGEGREDGGGAVLKMSVYSHAERLFCAFHEVTSATSVHVHFNSAGGCNAVLGINHFCTCHGSCGGEHFLNLVVFDKN